MRVGQGRVRGGSAANPNGLVVGPEPEEPPACTCLDEWCWYEDGWSMRPSHSPLRERAASMLACRAHRPTMRRWTVARLVVLRWMCNVG